jgi:hypothetical protein
MTHDLEDIISTMRKKGHIVHEESNVPNIVGIRTAEPTNEFNDRLVMFWKDEEGKWISEEYTITTDPGAVHLQNPPDNSKGTAILKEGQYIGALRQGIHNNGKKARTYAVLYGVVYRLLPKSVKEKLSWMGRSHTALVQAAPVTVYRDKNRDRVLDLVAETQETGMYHINLHRNHPYEVREHVDAASAGCQVFKDPKEFKRFMKLLKRKLRQKSYEYTLLRDSDVSSAQPGKNEQYKKAA